MSLRQQIEFQVRTGNVSRRRVLQRVGHRRRVGGGNRDAVDLLGYEIGDDLRFLVAAAVLARPDVEALHRALQFRFGLLAAGERLIEERIVGVLRHERERVGLRGGRDGHRREQGAACDGAG